MHCDTTITELCIRLMGTIMLTMNLQIGGTEEIDDVLRPSIVYQKAIAD